MTQYPLFIAILALGVIVFFACLESYTATKRAHAAMMVAHRAHIRLDRMQKTATVSNKETVAVSYTEGWSPSNSWEDDFHGTHIRKK